MTVPVLAIVRVPLKVFTPKLPFGVCSVPEAVAETLKVKPPPPAPLDRRTSPLVCALRSPRRTASSRFSLPRIGGQSCSVRATAGRSSR